MARFLLSHILLLLVVLLSLVLGAASHADGPRHHDHDHHHDNDHHHDHNENDDHNANNVNNNNNNNYDYNDDNVPNNADTNGNNVPNNNDDSNVPNNNADSNNNNVPNNNNELNGILNNAGYDSQVRDRDSLEGWEPERRARVMKIVLGVVSFLLVVSLVFNCVLLYKCCTRKRHLTYSKAQEVYKVPLETVPPYSESGPPCTPPPPYEVKVPPKVNAWVEKKELPCY